MRIVPLSRLPHVPCELCEATQQYSTYVLVIGLRRVGVEMQGLLENQQLPDESIVKVLCMPRQS